MAKIEPGTRRQDWWQKRQPDKKSEAIARQEERDQRSNEEQLVRLDKMLGKDKGARKERARLSKSKE